MSRAVPYVRWHMIDIHQCMNAILYDGVEPGPDMFLRTLWHWDWHLSLSPAAIAELMWWSTNIRRVNGAPIWIPPVGLIVTTDASETGWGAWSGGRLACGPFNSLDAVKHSSQRELLAVFLALKTLL